MPNSIEVKANDQIVKPLPSVNGEFEDLKNHLSCGENNFFFENGTIEFVVTGDDCQVKVKLTSYVQITTRIETTINDFYEQDFIDNIVAFLGIDPGRLKIVSVSEGSVIVKFIIQ